MITTTIENLITTYYAWLRAKTSVQQVDGQWSIITTPYLERHKDYLQIYVYAHPWADTSSVTTDTPSSIWLIPGATCRRHGGANIFYTATANHIYR